MPLNSSNYPMPGGPFVEQATAAPGEVRKIDAKRCWKSIADTTLNRCQLRLGHAGDCVGWSAEELAQGYTDG